MRVYVDIDNGGDLHNFIIQYAKKHDVRMREAYAKFLKHGREAIEAEGAASIEGTLSEEESPLDSEEAEFAQGIAEEMPDDGSIDDHFDDFHETVQERAQDDEIVADDLSPVLVRWHIIHYY